MILLLLLRKPGAMFAEKGFANGKTDGRAKTVRGLCYNAGYEDEEMAKECPA